MLEQRAMRDDLKEREERAEKSLNNLLCRLERVEKSLVSQLSRLTAVQRAGSSLAPPHGAHSQHPPHAGGLVRGGSHPSRELTRRATGAAAAPAHRPPPVWARPAGLDPLGARLGDVVPGERVAWEPASLGGAPSSATLLAPATHETADFARPTAQRGSGDAV